MLDLFHPPYTRNIGGEGARFDRVSREGVEEPVRRRHGTATLVELVPFAQDVGADMCISGVSTRLELSVLETVSNPFLPPKKGYT